MTQVQNLNRLIKSWGEREVEQVSGLLAVQGWSVPWERRKQLHLERLQKGLQNISQLNAATLPDALLANRAEPKIIFLLLPNQTAQNCASDFRGYCQVKGNKTSKDPPHSFNLFSEGSEASDLEICYGHQRSGKQNCAVVCLVATSSHSS